MKFLTFFAVLFSISMAIASQNLNHIACYYHHTPNGWNVKQIFFSKTNSTLAVDEAQFLTRGWTGGKVGAPNYGYCTRMIGTASDDEIVIESFHYQAKNFSYLTPDSSCTLSGDTVELISKTSATVQRGNFTQLESEWTPPHVDKIQIREYFPRLEEMDKIAEMSAQKCAELLPQ